MLKLNLKIRSCLKILLSVLFPCFFLKRIFFQKIFGNKSKSLRVLILHDIAPNQFGRLKDTLTQLSKFYTFISPEKFESLISRREEIEDNYILLTFDDGFKSNLYVAQEILSQLNIQAIFFVVSDLVSLDNRSDVINHITRFVDPELSIEDVSLDLDAMTWSDLKALVSMGHSIGCHSKSHLRLSSIQKKSILNKEIFESADIIEKNIGAKVNHFAFPFGDIDSFSELCFAICVKRYKFVHTGIRGDNAKLLAPHTIWRDSLSLKEPFWFSGLILEGGIDVIYSKSRNEFLKWNTNLTQVKL